MKLGIPLKTLVWVYDLDKHYIRYANKVALEWWHAESIDALNKRNFGDTTSDAVKQGLKGFATKFKSKQTIQALWQFSPLGETKQAFCQFSGVMVDDEQGQQRIAMLVEATPVEYISPHINTDSTITLASFAENGELLSCNPPFAECFGDNVKSIQQIIAPEQNLEQRLFAPLKTNLHLDTEFRFVTSSGETWFQLEATCVEQTSGETNILCNFHNIQSHKDKQLALFQQTQTDSLTDLLNRAGLHSTIDGYISSDIPFYLYYVDLDGFKMINDSLGHGAGDIMLKQIAKRLLALEHPHLKVCRFGGDEFVVATAYVDCPRHATNIAEEIVQQLSIPYHNDNGDAMLVSASVGFASYPNDSDSSAELIRYADSAMYASKRSGKRRWTIFQKGMEESLVRNSMITQKLPNAIAQNKLRMKYQKIVDVANNQIYSFEALLRWEDDELGTINPLEIIDVAERSGMIVELERWVIAKTISDLRALREQSASKAMIAINISATHLTRHDFPIYVLKQVNKNRLEATDVVIEITESVLLEDVSQSGTTLKSITKHGFHLSIDDFGTGYSSLAYLHKIKADTVKIDKAFLSKYSSSQVTLSAIKNLIESLGMKALIEGVETAEQASLCASIGITLHQGYYYQMPTLLGEISNAD